MKAVASLSFGLLFSVLGLAQTPDTAYQARIAAHRAHYKQEFLTEPRSPLRAQDTALLDFYAPNPVWRCKARVERTPEAQPFDMPTYSGRKKQFVQYGLVHFKVAGQARTLAIYQNLGLMAQEEYKDHLFLPFKDHTNGDSTYGGGRYLDFKIGDIADEGALDLDFNKAYNPWCAFSDGFNCPVPPATNHLELEVPAGEKNFRGEKKH